MRRARRENRLRAPVAEADAARSNERGESPCRTPSEPRCCRPSILALPAAGAAQHGVRNDPVPARVGTCAFTHVRQVGQRLEDGVTHHVIAGSGSAVTLANGLYQVSYEEVGAVARSRRGDPVYACLMKLPTGCPPGDNRGKLYTTTNLRTDEAWVLPDAEHYCGGA